MSTQLKAENSCRVDVLTVSYGDCECLVPLLQSLAQQANVIDTVYIWHNGPAEFDRSTTAQFTGLTIEVNETGQNLGYGAGINQCFGRSKARVAVIVNPDVSLTPGSLEHLMVAATANPQPVLVGGLLTMDSGSVNAFALTLTVDGLGINEHRGRDAATLGPHDAQHAKHHAVAPSGAFFSVNRSQWNVLGGGPLFPESLFLYMEDVALGLRVRRQGGQLAFCMQARGTHRFSVSTGQRSALKFFYVERNRIWLQRALGTRSRAIATTPATIARLASYVAGAVLARGQAGSAMNVFDVLALTRSLARAWREGFWGPLPNDLVPYLGANPARSRLRDYGAALTAQFRDPTA